MSISRASIGAALALTRRRVLVAGLLVTAGCASVLSARQAGPGKPPPAWKTFPEAEVAKVENPHNYLGGSICQRCHSGPDGGLRAEPVALCKGCHSMRHGNHPVEVVQKVPSKDLPYGPGGRILCHTCHDPHDMLAHKKGLRLAFNELCLKCHQQH